MIERRPCNLTYDERGGFACDLREGHDGPCDLRAAAVRRLAAAKEELRAAEDAFERVFRVAPIPYQRRRTPRGWP